MKQNKPYLLTIFFLIFFLSILFVKPVSIAHAQNSFDWVGEWQITLTSGDQSATTDIVINRNANGSLTATLDSLFYMTKQDTPPGYPKHSSTTTTTEDGSDLIIHLDNYHTGSPTFNEPPAKIKTSSCTITLRQTSDPNRITGEETCLTTHFITGNEAGWYVVKQPKPFNPGLIQIEGIRVGGAAQPQPPAPPASGNLENATFSISMGCIDQIDLYENIDCSLTITPDKALTGTAFSIIWFVDGVVSGENGGSITRDSISTPPISAGTHQVTVNVTSIATGKTLSASSTTWVEDPDAIAPLPQEPADQPPEEDNPAAPPPSADSTADFSATGDRVSAVGQSATAAATFLFVLAWLFLEGQPAPANSTGSLAQTIIDESGTVSEQEAGDWLAGNTSAILDNLNKPPAQPPPAQPPAVHPGTAQGGNKPGEPYTGNITNVRLEVLSDQDAYLVMQAMGLVPTELTETDHLMEVTREDLDHLLGGHQDGNPHWVRLPNGNEILACEVRGLAFEDLYNARGSETNTIDFQDHFSISVYIADPDTSVPPPAAGSKPGDGVGPAASPSSAAVASDGPAGDTTGGTSSPDVTYADDSVQEEATDVYDAESSGTMDAGSADREAAQTSAGSPASTTDAASDEAELDRFFDSQESAGTQDTLPAEGAEDLGAAPDASDSLVNQTDQGEAQTTSDNYTRDLNRRIDNLIDELKDARAEPPTVADSSGGQGGGSSTAGIIDGEDSTSATEGF